MGAIEGFWPVIALVCVWGLLFAAAEPIRQTYINGLIPSRQRASILSFDSLMSSAGGVVTQPALGRAADVWGYPSTYLLSGAISAAALPFIARSRAENAPADVAAGITEAREPAKTSPQLAAPEFEDEPRPGAR
jgi:MFS family permease